MLSLSIAFIQISIRDKCFAVEFKTQDNQNFWIVGRALGLDSHVLHDTPCALQTLLWTLQALTLLDFKGCP